MEQSCSTTKPLPPVSERVFDEFEIENITDLLDTTYSSFEVLRLHKSVHGIALGSIKLASKSSRFGNCSKIIVRNKVVEILRFVKCHILIKDEGHNETRELWLVKCSPYMEHPCKTYFGRPTQVWASSLENDYDFYKLDEITNRVTYAKTKVNFGLPVGEDSVLIVSPIPIS